MGLKHDSPRALLLFTAADRCALDALYAVTGMTLGCHHIMLKNYGNMAMPLAGLNTGQGLCLWSRQCVNAMPF